MNGYVHDGKVERNQRRLDGLTTKKKVNLKKQTMTSLPYYLPKLTKLRDSEGVPHVVTPSA